MHPLFLLGLLLLLEEQLLLTDILGLQRF